MAEQTYQELATAMARRMPDVLLPALARLGRLSACGVDLDQVDPRDLGRLPTMTKRDLPVPASRNAPPGSGPARSATPAPRWRFSPAP